MKLELLTNATVIDDAIRFVSEKQMEDVENKQNDEKIQQQPGDDYRKNYTKSSFLSRYTSLKSQRRYTIIQRWHNLMICGKKLL